MGMQKASPPNSAQARESRGARGALEDERSRRRWMRAGERHLREAQRQTVREGDVRRLLQITGRKASNPGETHMPSWQGEPQENTMEGRFCRNKLRGEKTDSAHLILFSSGKLFTPIKRAFISTV